MRHPLRNQILFPFAGLVTAAVVAVSAAGAWYAARTVERRIDDHLREAAEVLLSAEFPLTDNVLRQTRGLSGAEFVLTDSAGRVRAASLGDVGDDFAAQIETPAAGDATFVHNGIEYLRREAVRPPRGSADDRRRLHMLYPQSLRRQLMRQAVWPPMMIGAAALAAAWILSYALATRVCRPIADVQRQFAALARGEFTEIELPARDDEMRQLIGSANVLARRLAERDRAVQRATRSTLLGQLSGGLCHHLRNAAAGAKLALQLHRRRCHNTDAESLDVALRQLELSEQCVQRLLTLGKPNAPRLQSLDLRDVVADATSLVEPTFRHRGTTLRVELPTSPATLPAADGEQLRQLLVNLLLNAVDAAGPAGWTEVALATTDDDVRLRVTDGGDGPPREIVEHLFEPFVTGKPDGIGLGLAGVRQIAATHGGTVVYSRNPHTSFEVILPKFAVDAPPVPVDVPRTPALV